VITDEQHRFGVGQRKLLQGKAAAAPDTLVMSATPIPRTLSLIIYGDLNISSLTEKPFAGGVIQTNSVPRAKLTDMYGFIAGEVEKGAAAYFVCPRIGDEDDGDGESEEGLDPGGGADEKLTDVKTLYKDLKKTSLNKYGIGFLHGRMPEEQKNAALTDFSAGKTKSLVSTTVIEVGIDVKAASIIVIYNAGRFGLSQLHQLRGRVGRAGQKAWCFLISDTLNEETAGRLNMLKSTQDGFALSEYDFEKRGAGDFLGEKQHGNPGGVPLTYGAVAEAKEIAGELLQDSGKLEALQRVIDGSPDLDILTRIALN